MLMNDIILYNIDIKYISKNNSIEFNFVAKIAKIDSFLFYA